MDAKEKEVTWIQCQNCGKVHIIYKRIPISISIVRAECPRCGEYSGLNCGSNEDDFYIYMNPNADERFYNY